VEQISLLLTCEPKTSEMHLDMQWSLDPAASWVSAK